MAQRTGGFFILLTSLIILWAWAPHAAVASFCAFPVVTEAAIDDVHENGLNGPLGFLYFVNPGGAKTGTLPRMIDHELFETDAYASNLQGPTLVRVKRDQHEWAANGWIEISKRRYPLVFQHRCRESTRRLGLEQVRVKEDDDFLSPDDKVGAFDVDYSRCSEVWSTGTQRGWTREEVSQGKPYERGGSASIKYVVMKLWCYTCQGPADCQDGIVW